MYTDCYDEKHKILEVSRLNAKVVRRQKGIYNSFMCEGCEEETQRFDHRQGTFCTFVLSYSKGMFINTRKV